MNENIAQYRICVEKTTPKGTGKLDKININNKSSVSRQRLRAAFYTKKLWPSNSVITISFIKGSSKTGVSWTPVSVLQNLRTISGKAPYLDMELENAIRELSPVEAVKYVIINRIQPMVNLQFKFVKKKGNVRISFDPDDGSWSLIGKDCLDDKSDKATLNYGWLDGPVIQHEIGHVLGLIHEHQNPAGKPIDWDEPKVYNWAMQTQGWDKKTTFTNIIEKYDKTQLNGSDFDPESIMLYFFPGELTKNGIGTNPNETLSLTDIIYIHDVYPQANSTFIPEKFYAMIHSQKYQSTSQQVKTIIINIFKFLGIIIAILILVFSIRKLTKKG
jgi:hypothetical protein